MIPGAALITGASTRIGRAMSLALAQDGWDVAIHYHSGADAAQEVIGQTRALGVQAEAIQADLLDIEATADLVPRAAAALGQPLTLLINNASIFEYDNLTTATMDSWDRHIGSNLRAPFQLTQAFAAQVPAPDRDAKDEPVAQACVVNMIDQRVLKPTPEFMTYTIAKMGLWAFTRTSAQALAPKVRVNAIGPGPTLQGARQSAEHFAAQRKATLLERGSDPEEICKTLTFILSANGLTGQLFCLDGGQHLGWKTPDVLGVE